MKAPEFSLLDQHGATHTLADYANTWLVIYFYPKDDTPGCTKEACGFRDATSEYAERNAAVIGISKDTVGSHKRFAEKFELPFPVLSDASTETIQAYQAWGPKKFMGREFLGILRQTVIVDPSGEIVRRYENVDPTVHAIEVLNDLKAMQAA